MDKGRISIEIDYEKEAIRLAVEKAELKEECEKKEMRIRELEAELRGIKNTMNAFLGYGHYGEWEGQ